MHAVELGDRGDTVRSFGPRAGPSDPNQLFASLQNHSATGARDLRLLWCDKSQGGRPVLQCEGLGTSSSSAPFPGWGIGALGAALAGALARRRRAQVSALRFWPPRFRGKN
jgi:hypothetical protein